jgi:hypothetical protein
MKHPQYRRRRFDRNEMAPLQRDPANPLPGLCGSTVSLLVVCWEKYSSAAFHDALDSVENPDVPVAHHDEHAGSNRKLALFVFGCSAVAVVLLAWVCRPRGGADRGRRARKKSGKVVR